MLTGFGVKFPEAEIAEAVLDVKFEDIFVIFDRAGPEFFLAGRQIPALDEVGKSKRRLRLLRAVVDWREDVGDERQHVLFRAVIIAVARELLADSASDGCAILDFVPIESDVPTTVSSKHLALLHVLADPPPL